MHSSHPKAFNRIVNDKSMLVLLSFRGSAVIQSFSVVFFYFQSLMMWYGVFISFWHATSWVSDPFWSIHSFLSFHHVVQCLVSSWDVFSSGNLAYSQWDFVAFHLSMISHNASCIQHSLWVPPFCPIISSAISGTPSLNIIHCSSILVVVCNCWNPLSSLNWY